MTAHLPDPRVGTELGPYRIEAVLGRGGMGVVYRATHTGLDRRVALKLLSPDYVDDDAFRARFLRESKLAASIDHPNIIPVYDAGQIGGTYFLAMRYVDGTDLASVLRSGPLEARYAAAVLGQVGSALDAAHAAGLVHRDVKPANILIAPGQGHEGSDHAYLTDFGLTKQRGSQTELTQAAGFLGTLDYIAPEQIEGRDVDGSADEYALAAVAVAMLTGVPAFPRDTDVAVINAHLHDSPPSLHDRRAELPADIDPIIARAMAKRAHDRYPDCRAFVDELRSALGVTATQPRPPARSDNRRWLVAIGGGLAVILTIAVARAIGLTSGSAATGTTASPSAVGGRSPSPPPSPTADVFPNSNETALLRKLPPDLATVCERGPYDLVVTDQAGPPGGVGPAPEGHTPVASVSCPQTAVSGANEVVVRSFDPGYVGFTEQAISGIARRANAAGGECATSRRANGRWQLNGQDAGAIVCYVDSSTGDAILAWSYPDARILVRATNQHGDSAALYRWFNDTARFIAP